MQKHVIGRGEVDVPTADGHHLQGGPRGQVQHQVGHGLQEPVEHFRQGVDGLAGQVQVTERVPTPGLRGVGGAVHRADFGRQSDHEPPQEVVQTRRLRHLVQQPVQGLAKTTTVILFYCVDETESTVGRREASSRAPLFEPFGNAKKPSYALPNLT